MRVLVLASWYPDARNEVRGIFFRDQANALAAAGHHVTVLVSERKSPRSVFGDRGFAQLGQHGFAGVDEGEVRVYRNAASRLLPAGLFPISAELGMVKDAISFMPELLDARGPFDIIHAQSAYWGGAIAEALSKAMGVPFIVQEHRSNFLSDTLGRNTKRELERILNRASFVTAVSENLITLLRNWYGVGLAKSCVLPNMVHARFFNTTARKSSASFRFTMVGSLVPVKRHDLGLRAFAEVSGTRDDVELHVVGDGPLRSSLERLARELRIDDRLYWHGRRSPAELPSLYGSFDALVLASDHETFGVVLAEAWASGIPVIATRCGGPDSLVKPFNGILVEKGSSAALADAMNDMLRRRKEFEPVLIRETARAEYGGEAVIAATVRIYEKAIEYFRSPNPETGTS